MMTHVAPIIYCALLGASVPVVLDHSTLIPVGLAIGALTGVAGVAWRMGSKLQSLIDSADQAKSEMADIKSSLSKLPCREWPPSCPPVAKK